MERSREIIDRYFAVASGELIIGKTPVSQIVKEYGSPLYVYDLDVLQANYQSLRRGLSESVRIFYSIKANPAPAICECFRKLGTGAEIGSGGELQIAIDAGFNPSDIIYAGPGKTWQELENSVCRGLFSINVESIQEIVDIAKIAEESGKKANFSLRVNPEINVSGSQMKMGGVPGPFGIDEEKIPQALAEKSERLNFRGIHVYVGNQIFDTSLAIKNIENTLEIARKVSKKHGEIEMVNLGGGFGIPYYKKQIYFDEAEFQRQFNALLASARKEKYFRKTTFILELGRYLTARCGVFITKVLYTKESRGQRFAVVDGGMNYCSIATGNLGQKIRRNFPVCAANRLDCKLSEEINVVGPLCTPMDSFGKPFLSPPLKRGDLLAVFFVGAYGFSASPRQFLSHRKCREITISASNL